MSITIKLVRHGETDANRLHVFAGSSETPLTPLGILQAQKTRGALSDWPIDAVYASTLSRARGTAAVIAGLPVDHSSILVDERIIEGGFGKWEGQLKPTIDPHSHAERLAGGVEDPSAIKVRMLAFWNDLVADSALVGKNVLVVGHGWSLRILFLALAEGGILAHCVVPRTLGNCSITTIVVTRTGGSGYRAEMTDLDNVEHFDSEEITAIE